MEQRAIPSVVGKLATLAAVSLAFTFALVGTIWLSLRSPEVKVPEVVGKSLPEAESTLAGAGLSVRTRARRFSAEVKPDTVLDQTPRPGETVKKGQTIAIVLSRAEAKEGESSVGLKRGEANGSANENQNGTGGESAEAGAPAAHSANNTNNTNNANKPKKSASRNKNANNANSGATANSNVNSNLSTNLATNAPAGNRNAEESPAPNRNGGEHNANGRNANATTNAAHNTNTLVIVNPNANAGRSRTVANANNRNANAGGGHNSNPPRNANRRPPGV